MYGNTKNVYIASVMYSHCEVSLGNEYIRNAKRVIKMRTNLRNHELHSLHRICSQSKA